MATKKTPLENLQEQQKGNGMYEIIYADPAWPYFGSMTKNAAAGKHYDLMDWDDLAAMPVRDLAADSAALFMWATSPLLHKQIALIEKWGFHYRGIAFVWVKTRKDGGIIHGQGIPPTFTKPNVELLLAATTKKRGRPFKMDDFTVPQVVLSPRGAHSAKPEIFREHILRLCGDRPRVELFARNKTEGWHASGNELNDIDYRKGILI